MILISASFKIRTHSKYHSSESSSYVANGTDFEYKSADGLDLIGYLSQDTLWIGDLKVRNQIFAEITVQPEDSQHVFSQFDGVLGLNLDTAHVTSATGVLYNLMQQGLLRRPGFALWLSNEIDVEPAGEVTFGGVNRQHYYGELSFANLISNTSNWEFMLEHFYVGDTQVFEKPINTIVDSASSLMYFPKILVEAIYKKMGLSTNSLYSSPFVDCDAFDTLPELKFLISGKNFSMSPAQYMLSVIAHLPPITTNLSNFLPSIGWRQMLHWIQNSAVCVW